MPIKSYLAHPHEGKKSELIEALSAINECEVIPAQNQDLLIVVTDTQDKFEEEILKEKLDAIESLKLLAMVSGFNTSKNH
jgi:nitrate reductase NapAB chaperone NapD